MEPNSCYIIFILGIKLNLHLNLHPNYCMRLYCNSEIMEMTINVKYYVPQI